MAAETKYKSVGMIMRSRGLMARPATDQPPSENFYLNMDGAL